ncbi:hypothetical protein [Pedobacter sandarakinus]|uniref:hypothetical protein n=1 Tax=Pedobacter sandarakinus TaxID=353156 RepID=UPI0022462CC3|nr:hypothetical protein [Pedobacter sandarakinus]MCX2574956.1 hypothetical protein [Pedobacter sandarakinus]
MKKLLILVFAVFSSYLLKAQTLVLSKDAKASVGKTVTICDSVYSTKGLENLTLINLGGAFPKELITVVINKPDIGKFASEPASMFLGNNICVTGVVTEYKGKFQIVVTEPKQIVVK